MSRRALVWAAGGVSALALARQAVRRHRAWDLAGRSALVTGGSRGLGLLVARELVREGARVTIVARDERELERAGEALRARGGDVLTVRCDVNEPGQVDAAFRTAAERHGPVEVLVNNAGIIQSGPVETLTPADLADVMAVNLWGVVHCTWAALPEMLRRREGRIVNVTSIGGRVAVPHLLGYTCSKFAAVGLSEGLRAELARHGIAVVTVVPGLMRTGSFLNAYFKGNREAEFALFSLADSLPLVSIDAERAARRIVVAARRGEADVTLGAAARALGLLHGLAPGLTADLLGLVTRVLPRAAADGHLGESRPPEPGHAVRERLASPTLDRFLTLGLSAARRFHQVPGPTPA